MITNDRARALIMQFEGCRLEAYLCPAKIPTIGFGHTEGVKIGQKITRHQAEVILEHDLEKFEKAVETLCPKSVLNSNQFSALVSLCFNIGEANLASSTLRKKFNSGAPLSAAEEFPKWNKARVNGALVPLAGLTKRREAERALYLSPVGVA